MNDRESVLHHLIFRTDPYPVAVDHTAKWSSGELMDGVRALMNIGVSKEQLYVTPPFSEIFLRFEKHLAAVDAVVIIGYSFRDYVVNRLLLQAVKSQWRLRGKRLVVVLVDPDVKTLIRRQPVLAALEEYGVLLARPEKAGSVTEAGLLSWLGTSLPTPPPNGYSYRTPRATVDDGLRDQLSAVRIELALLRHQIQDALGLPVNSWRVLEGIVQAVERCRGVYEQVVGTPRPGLRRTIAKMYSREDVHSTAWATAGAELLADLAAFSAQLDTDLERSGPLTATSFDGGAANRAFDAFFDHLRGAGVQITESQFIP
jgi:hypothetical protein